MYPSLLGFGSFVVGLSGRGVVLLVGGIAEGVMLVCLIVVVVLLVGLTVGGKVAPCEKERLYATTSRNTSCRGQGQLCKGLLGVCSLAFHLSALPHFWASQN